MTRVLVATMSAVVALTVAAPVHAQGNGKRNSRKGGPPSSSVLPSPTAVSPAAVGTVPFAWIDDASVLPPGDAALSISMARWQGTDASEIEVPVVGAAMGLTDRVQLGASIPRVAGGGDPAGTAGGLGTTYVSAKVGVLTGGRFGVRLAVAPTLEILGSGTLPSLAPGESRTQFGLPVSAELDRGAARLFASAGFFSGGVRFAGGGLGLQADARVSISAALSRAWTTDPSGTMQGDRRELSGGVGFQVTPHVSLFGSLSRTIATSDQDGAGTTVNGGVIVLLAPAAAKKHRGR